jgi:predicted MFS family arabinose efflux permease
VTRPAEAAVDATVRREAWILIVAGLFMSASQSLSSVALPIVLLQHGSGAGGVGTVLALMNLAGMAELLVVGAYADRGWIRFFLIFFPATSLVGVIPFLTPTASLAWLAAGTVVGGFGGGSGATSGGTGPYQPAEYGWIAHHYPARLRNTMVSRFSARDVCGVFLAGLLALASAPVSASIGFGPSPAQQGKTLMAIVAITACVPVALGFFIREPGPRESTGPSRLVPGPSGPLTWSRRLTSLLIPEKSRWLLLRLSITNGLNGLATGTYGMFLTTWLVLRFHASAGQLGLINLLIAGTAMFGDLACPYLARRTGLVRAVIITRLVQALLIIPIAFAPTVVVAQVLLIARQFMQRLNTALRDSYTLGQADPGEKARMTAMSNVASSAAQSVSAQVAGQVIDRIGFTIPFVFSALAQVASSLVFFAFFARRPPPEEVQRVREAPEVPGPPAEQVAGERVDG